MLGGLRPSARGGGGTAARPQPRESSVLEGCCRRWFAPLAAAVLALALFNLVFRINREIVMQWDESLYANSAWEMVKSGNWIATTLLGQLDYYNTKPPLNVWLIALSFKSFGFSLVSLRLPCVLSAWGTVAVMVFWVRRCAGNAIALLTGLVLSTCFGFLYGTHHIGASTDQAQEAFALTAVTLWASETRPWRAAWLGPLLASAFMLRGPAALMFGVLIAGYWFVRRDWLRGHVRVAATALLLFLAPVLAWSGARWQIDHGRFFAGMFNYDLVARAARPLEGHAGSVVYYVNILAKHQYDWLLAALAAMIVTPRWDGFLSRLRSWRRDAFSAVLVVWVVVGLALPSVMSTKVPWYLNPSYPVFAVGVALVLVRGLSAPEMSRTGRGILVGFLVVAALAAEAKLLWYSRHHRDISRSVQGLLLSERDRLAGHRVFRADWDRAEIFVVSALAGADRRLAAGFDDFLAQSSPGDYLVVHRPIVDDRLSLAGQTRRNWLYRRDW